MPDDVQDGCWAEVLMTFGAELYAGQDVDARVLVQPQNGKFVQGDTDLTTFQHPDGDNILYIFGPDHGHLETEPICDAKVYIPAVKQSVTLWSHQAAGIVLWDRIVKNGNP